MINFHSLDFPDFPAILQAMADPEAFAHLKEKIDCLPACSRFTDDQIDIIYGIGYSAYTQGKIQVACNIFQMLLFYRPLEERLIFAFGICSKKLSQYENAMACFASLVVMSPLNFSYALHFSECLVARNMRKESIKVLDPLINASYFYKYSEAVHNRAVALKDIISADH